MHVDTHCHIDLFDDPIATARAYESAQTDCVMATMLPSHYLAALPHLKPFRTIWPALGMHPLRTSDAKNEIEMFLDHVSSAEYVGEIGMDLSAEGRSTKKTQLSILRSVLPVIGTGKFVTIHSRQAHEEISSVLDEYSVSPVCFHYFIGGPHAAEELVTKGHYFSINHRMLRTKHRNLLDVVPRDRILVESDGPFLTKRPLAMIEHVYDDLGELWHTGKCETEELIALNFIRCRTTAPQRDAPRVKEAE